MLREEYTDSASTSIEIEESASFLLDRVDSSGIEFLSSETVYLEKRLRLYLECESEELISDTLTTIEEMRSTCHDIGSPGVFEEVDRCYLWICPGEFSDDRVE